MIRTLFKVMVTLLFLPLRILWAILGCIFATRRLPDGSRLFPSFKRILFRIAMVFSILIGVSFMLRRLRKKLQRNACECDDDDDDENEDEVEGHGDDAEGDEEICQRKTRKGKTGCRLPWNKKKDQ